MCYCIGLSWGLNSQPQRAAHEANLQATIAGFPRSDPSYGFKNALKKGSVKKDQQDKRGV